MYIKNPSSRRDIHVPENYGGNAFKNNIYTDIVPPAEDITSSTPADIADNSQTIPPRTVAPPPLSYTQKLSPQLPIQLTDSTQAQGSDAKAHSTTQSSIFSSLLPSVTSSRHFPFGHGIGSEELFILGIMLLIYMSGNDADEVDSELLLLLCILLFSG